MTTLAPEKPVTRTFRPSCNGVQWQLRPVNDRQALTIAQRLDIPQIIARTIAGRDIDIDQAELFLNPTLKEQLPDPFHLLDMDKAAARLAEAITNGQKIAIFGDYDVDGATSSALLTRFCRMVGSNAFSYIPDRIEEGYGPNTPALLKLKEHGFDLVITVDCGAVSFEPLEAAHKAGLDVVVIDHHLGAETLPKAVAVVNPNRLDETSAHRNLAAVGVAFLLAVATNSLLRKQGWYNNAPAPNLLSLLDLVALGTVCDVMSLTGVNRALVSQGLKILANRNNIGLRALADIAKIDSKPSAYHLGFVLGPRINAGGRVGKSSLGSTLLSTEDTEEAYNIAVELNQLNAERKAIEQIVLDEALAQAEASDTSHMVMVAGEGWHPGVIGIVASRLKEKYNRPAVVIALDKGEGKASCRSVTGVDFGAAVSVAKANDLLVAGGGHAMAAGFTVEEGKITDLQQFFAERFAKGVADYDANRCLMLDGCVTIPAITVDFAETLDHIAPFGVGNPAPRFAITDCYIIKADIVGQDHIRVIIGHSASASRGGSMKAMAFRAVETPLGDMLLSSGGKSLHIAGQIRVNLWQGNKTAEFTIEDATLAG